LEVIPLFSRLLFLCFSFVKKGESPGKKTGRGGGGNRLKNPLGPDRGAPGHWGGGGDRGGGPKKTWGGGNEGPEFLWFDRDGGRGGGAPVRGRLDLRGPPRGWKIPEGGPRGGGGGDVFPIFTRERNGEKGRPSNFSSGPAKTASEPSCLRKPFRDAGMGRQQLYGGGIRSQREPTPRILQSGGNFIWAFGVQSPETLRRDLTGPPFLRPPKPPTGGFFPESTEKALSTLEKKGQGGF